jgi:excisionase family DNA binding protein
MMVQEVWRDVAAMRKEIHFLRERLEHVYQELQKEHRVPREGLLTLDEVADIFRVSRRTVDAWVKAHRLRVVRMSPNHTRVRPIDILKAQERYAHYGPWPKEYTPRQQKSRPG